MPSLPRWTPAALFVLAGSSFAMGAGPFPASFNLSSLDGTNGLVINGIHANDLSGNSVSSAGDVNGDGVDDMVIGTLGATPYNEPLVGQSYVVFGGAGIGAGSTLDLFALDGSNGFIINGIDSYDFSGASVSDAGDVNGDGFDDVIIGAFGANPDVRVAAGESYVIFGGPGIGAGGVLELLTLNGANGFVIRGINPNDWSGRCVSSAGDVNDDGVDDLIIVAPQGDPIGRVDAGECYVVFGGAGIGAGGSLQLHEPTFANGYIINGIDADDRLFCAARAGDVNGDGVDDLIIASYQAAPNGQSGAGESYVVFGGASVGAIGTLELGSLNGVNGFVINGIDANDASGVSVSSAGDVNDDGVDDVIIGAQHADPNGQLGAGESYVVFGRHTAIEGNFPAAINLSALDGANGFVINGVRAEDWCGTSVSSAGDVNADGVSDLIIGAPNADPGGHLSAGATYVVFGRAGIGAGGLLELSSLNGANGFVLNGIREGDQAGSAVSSAGDVNGDGRDDMLIGAIKAPPHGFALAGETYVVFGRGCRGDLDTDGDTDIFDFASLLAGFGLVGMPPHTGGDLDGDGDVDVLDFATLAGNFGCGSGP